MEKVTLHYKDLEFIGCYQTRCATYWEPPEYDEIELCRDYDFNVNKEDVVDFIYQLETNPYKNVIDIVPEFELDNLYDNINKNIDYYIEKYEDTILEQYKEGAIEDAWDNYEVTPEDLGIEENDYDYDYEEYLEKVNGDDK